MKTITKVVGYIPYERFSKGVERIDISAIDTPIPAIIYNPDTHEAVHGETHKVIGYYPIGATLEIESTFHQAGEIIHGHVLNHDCYIRNIKVLD